MTSRNESHRLSRREFLVAAGVGAGAIVLGPALSWAADGLPEEGFDFIIVSDTHVGYKGGDNGRKAWVKATADLAKAKGDFVLHLGDIVDGGRAEQYPIYKQLRDGVGKKFYEVPGNHDPAELFAQHIRKEIDTTFDHKSVRFVLFNNTKADSHDAAFSSQQAQWMDKVCTEAAAAKMAVILCAHVPCHANKSPDRGWYLKPADGQKDFYDVIAKHKNSILAVVHGHFHNGIRGWDDNGVNEVTLPSVLYNQKRNLAGAPGYHFPETKPGYTVARLTRDKLTLTYKVIGGASSVSKTYDIKGKIS